VRFIQKLSVDPSLFAKLSDGFTHSTRLFRNVKCPHFEDRGKFCLTNLIRRGGGKMLERGISFSQQIQRFTALGSPLVEFG
jgi:hypothetical protein